MHVLIHQKSNPDYIKSERSYHILIDIFRAKDDGDVKVTNNTKGKAKTKNERDPNAMPTSAALVNGKYVTYTRITRDLAVILFTSADSLIRRFYLIKVIETYSEALYTTLWQLGINPEETYGLNYHSVIQDFQQHILYGFLLGIMLGMANTDPDEIEAMHNPNQASASSDPDAAFIPLTPDRIKFLVDLMRDVAYYVESKDFELGLPVTNFHHYHELWLMRSGGEDYSYYEGEEEEDDVEEGEEALEVDIIEEKSEES